MQVKLAREMGFCFGVRRAIEMVEKLGAKGGRVAVLGALVHNPQVIAWLQEQGVETVKSVDEVQKGTLVIPSHGAPPEVFARARARGLDVVDATCPFVRAAQRAAAALVRDSFQVILVGDRDHTEVKGIVGWTGGKTRVVAGPNGLAAISLAGKVGIVAQTTQTVENLKAVVDRVVECCLAEVRELRVVNTICSATVARQAAVAELASEVDIVLVVGGRTSANTRRLLEIARQAGVPAYQVEAADEVQKEWLTGRREVGVTAGASTPDDVVQEVVQAILALGSE